MLTLLFRSEKTATTPLFTIAEASNKRFYGYLIYIIGSVKRFQRVLRFNKGHEPNGITQSIKSRVNEFYTKKK